VSIGGSFPGTYTVVA